MQGIGFSLVGIFWVLFFTCRSVKFLGLSSPNFPVAVCPVLRNSGADELSRVMIDFRHVACGCKRAH